MKRLSWFVISVVMAFIAVATQVYAQTPDTLVIAPLPPGNINTVINSDTLAGGVRAHPKRVYVLRHGVVYQVSEPMVINGSITIVGNDTTAGLRPPVLAPTILPDNSSVDHYFDLNGKGGVVTIEDVYMTNFRADTLVTGWNDCIRQNADSVKLTLIGDVFEGWNHTALSIGAQWNKMLVEDCVFRNEIHPSAYFGGGAMLSAYTNNFDTVIFVNNTFFCNNSYLWSIRGYCPNPIFSHNTVVYGTVNPFLTRQMQNMRCDNNVFYSLNAYGGVPEDVINGTFLNFPDTTSSGIIMLRQQDSTSSWHTMWSSALGGGPITGPQYFIGTGGTGNATVTAAMVDPTKSFIDIRNNDYFLPQNYLDYLTHYNDTVTTKDSVDMPDGSKVFRPRTLAKPTWITDYTKYTLGVLIGEGAHVDTSGTMYVDPGFGTTVQNQLGSLINYLNKIALNFGPDTSWYFYPTSGALYPPTWPLPENLAYTNTSLQHAGTDDYALGDLNWFPTQKAAWLAAGGLALGVHKTPDVLPVKFDLSNNYPNPFNPSTNIRVSLVKNGLMSLKIYNVLGQLVKVVDEGYKQAGTYDYNVSMDQFASGLYFYTLQQGGNSLTKKMILLK
ncbi:MAG TPA: T9SS type A sorting domain-containing protein [Candidatus Acidoferrales bacterium]|nr:T9SS type A sorting domain-containing protein [Candidatus Acidoferrales bacterium]